MLKSGEQYAERQPRDGEVVLFCRHIDVSPEVIRFHGRQSHWLMFEEEIDVTRVELDDAGPKGLSAATSETIRSRWICFCAECFYLNAEEPEKAIAKHGAWIGDAPIIVQERVS
jgi:hypothetical protein